MKVKVKYRDGTVIEYNRVISIAKNMLMYIYIMEMDILKGNLTLKALKLLRYKEITSNENNI